MKKSILNLGKILNKTDQKAINGGRIFTCNQFCSASSTMQEIQISTYGQSIFSSCPC